MGRTTCALLSSVVAVAFAACHRDSSGGSTTVESEDRELDAAGYHVVDHKGRDVAESAPLVVVLHGRGGNPEDLLRVFRDSSSLRAEIASVKAPLPFGRGTQWFDWPPGSSEQELALSVDAAEHALWPALLELAHGRKLVVTGFSQGAVLSYTIACRHPTEVLLAVPLSGRATSGLGDKCARIVAFHGSDDNVIPLSFDKESVARLAAAGVAAELHELPGVKHQLPPAMRAGAIDVIARALSSSAQ